MIDSIHAIVVREISILRVSFARIVFCYAEFGHCYVKTVPKLLTLFFGQYGQRFSGIE